MARENSRRVWTQREDDLATFLFRTPATAEQIFAVSKTWAQPFASFNVTYRRIRDLIQSGWVFRSPLAIASQVGPRHYFQLTIEGFRFWKRNPNATPPTKRFFAPKSEASHKHLLAKAQFLTHLTIAAHHRGFTIENDRPENTFPIEVGYLTIWPDHYLELVGPYGKRFPRFFEFDRSTETLVSSVNKSDTWSTKNLMYDGYQNLLGRNRRFRVVVVTTESRQRLTNILSLFGRQTSNIGRQMYLGVHLDDFVEHNDPLCQPFFHDHRRSGVPLVPEWAMNSPPEPAILARSTNHLVVN